jgi:hypothetical protein
MLPNDDEAAWQLTGGGWLYVLRDADRAGRAVVTLLVDDPDERLADVLVPHLGVRDDERLQVRALVGVEVDHLDAALADKQ